MTNAFRPLSLRTRLTLLTAALAMGVGLFAAVAINVAAIVLAPRIHAVQIAPPNMLAPVGEPGPPDPSSPPPVTTIRTSPGPSIDSLRPLQVFSVAALLAAFVIGGMGAYWVAGRALSPVQRLNLAAKDIDAKSLATRLELAGPEDELKDLSRSFNGMLGRLERAFEQQRRFVGDAAHELKTPLTVLRTNLEVVRDDPQSTVEDYRQSAAALERAVDRLEHLVSDLLVLAMDEGLVTTEEVPLGSLLEEVHQELAGVATQHEVSLRFTGDLDAVVRGEPVLLYRVFCNLIENGIRYNRPHGTVTVDVTRENGWVRAAVVDRGIGLTPEDQAHVFERFYRADSSRSRNTGGAGLGLAIVHQVVERHGGEISMTSAVGEGSTFTVRLPQIDSKS